MKQLPICGLGELILMIWELAICEIPLEVQWEKFSRLPAQLYEAIMYR